jgi:chorismate dehydratase
VDRALKHCDAALLIGDEALTAYHFPLLGVTYHDLGRLWQEWTGLPMVYAVWATRESFARTHGPELRAVEDELVACMDYGREHLPQVVESAVGQFPFDREALTRYFALLRYDFTKEYRKGLRRFYELAHQAGELEEVPDFRFIDEYTGPDVPAVLDDTDPGAAMPEDLL